MACSKVSILQQVRTDELVAWSAKHSFDAGLRILESSGAADYADIQVTPLTSTRVITIPDASGTILLSADVGTTVQAYDAELAALAGLTSVANTVPYFTGSGTAALYTVSPFVRGISGSVDAAAFRAAISVPSIADLAAYQQTSEKNSAGGYAGLDSSSIVQPQVQFIRSGLIASRPSPSIPGRLFYATDTSRLSMVITV